MGTVSMDAVNFNAAANASDSVSEKLSKMIAMNSLDYESWRSLILEMETSSPDDTETTSSVYDALLSKFPLCHWHLQKYAYHKVKHSGVQEAIKIFEQGAAAAMFSVGFWIDYFTFATACFGEREDVRRLFVRSLTFVGRDYFCHVLWDKYMKYELDQEGWSFLAQSYIEAMRFPTKKLRFYYENFKKFVSNLEEEMGYEKNHIIVVEQLAVPFAIKQMAADEISLIVKDLLGSSNVFLKCEALHRYRSVGEQLYLEALQLDEKIKCFEKKIRRRYFSATPLDDDELSNWHIYLNFIEKQDNLDWAVKLYERCLIPCANYPEFWMRYIEFVESKRGNDLCLSVLDRATQIFLKNVPEIHLLNARFKERIGDVDGARAALLAYDTKSDSSFIENVVTKANMERRLGNLAGVSATYEKALKTAREKQKLHIVPLLYSHFARITFLITGSAHASTDILIDGIKRMPHSQFLFEELINFVMTHEGAEQLNKIDSVVADAISSELDEYDSLSAKDRERVSSLFLEFVNLCGSVNDFEKAWKRHIKLFPQSLRLTSTFKHPMPNNYVSDLIRAQKEGHNLEQLQNELYPGNSVQTLSKTSHEKADNASAKAAVLALSSEATVVSNENASQEGKLPAQSSSLQSSEGKLETMEICTEVTDHSKGNGISMIEPVHQLSCQSENDKSGPTDIIANQRLENISSNSQENDSQLSRLKKVTEPEEDGSLNQHNRTSMKVDRNDVDTIKIDQVKAPQPANDLHSKMSMNQMDQQSMQHGALLSQQPTDQMLQYYYSQQQHLIQQHYQQQPYQQAYQMHPTQQPYQQQQSQPLPYGMHQQMPYQNYGYQQDPTAHNQQVLWQQYQQYQQGYPQHQPQDMVMQQNHQSQMQKDTKSAKNDYAGASISSAPPHLPGQK